MAPPVPEEVEVAIVGGGPAGLSAALLLGRCRRRLAVYDTGAPRNGPSAEVRGFLTRDGTPPLELLAIARTELARYGIAVRPLEVTRVDRAESGFVVTAADDGSVRSRCVVLATGVRDVLPPLAGLPPLYGRSVFSCPYCDAWEVRDEPLAVYGRGDHVARLAIALRLWSRDVVVCTDGTAAMSDGARGELAAAGIAIRDERIRALEGSNGRLTAIRFASGELVPRRALFLALGQRQSSPLAAPLGCRLTPDGGIEVDARQESSVPGVFVVGDASRDVQLAIVAAAEGATAAVAINKQLGAAPVR
ncbi:MAG TPA: NAD(P)/FAD-dependent oxidoreductase [Candidatus Binatia bacterium]|nr:NAD(P)/FAD-dependent oxidoreductase [Candidatus Binatia bacterium]